MNKSQINNKSRRSFLADCGKMSAIGSMSSILNLTMTNKILAARPAGSIKDYKALVCVFLAGGADTFQMLQPGIEDYATYTERRQHFALDRTDQYRVVDGKNKDYHIHQSMPEVTQMFNDGDLSFVANVGSLVEPLTLSDLSNAAKEKPKGLGSHNDQTRQWQTSIASQLGGGIGWMGRMADIVNDAANNTATASMNLAPSGTNYMQQGLTVSPVSVRGGANSLDIYRESDMIRGLVDNDIEASYKSVLAQHYNHVKKEAIDQNQAIADLEAAVTIDTVFPSTYLGSQLLQTAKLIKIQGVLGLNRQTFFVTQGGWDTHTGVLDRTNGLFKIVSEAFAAFNEALKEIGYHDKVVTYTASDFGRTFVSSGSGNNHAWGSNQIVMGGPVKGGFVRGTYPDLAQDSSTNTSASGRQMPQVAVDELHASLGRWFGINNDSEMEQMLPNIRNFYAAGTQTGNKYYAIPWLFKA